MEDVLFFTAWLLLHDPEFITSHQHLDNLPDFFPKGPLRSLVAISARHWKEYRQPVGEPALRLHLAQGNSPELYGSTEQETLRAYADLQAGYRVTSESRAAASTACTEWLRLRQLGLSLDQALARLGHG